MQAGEVPIDVGLVSRLLTTQYPQWSGLAVEPVGSQGTDNSLFRLGEALVVRLPRVERAAFQVDLEHQWLPRLAPHLAIAVPTPVARGEPAHGYPWAWSIYRWLDGHNPAVGSLPEPHAMATDLARFVSALRGVRFSDSPASAAGQHLLVRDAGVRRAIAMLQRLPGPPIDLHAAAAAWDALLQVPPWDDEPVWVHGDLAPGNILVQGGRVSAVIDFSATGLSDPALDLIPAWNLLPGEARATFRDAVGDGEDTWARGKGWALSQALTNLASYYKIEHGIAAAARRVIAEILTD